MKVFGSILILLLSYSISLACSCVPPNDESKDRALKDTSVIFSGKVISTEKAPNEYQVSVKFQVLKSWKGVQTRETFVTTASDSAACGYNFEKDKTYTVYGYGNGKTPNTNLCSMLMVDEKRVKEAYGEGKSTQNSEAAPKTEQGFWSGVWRKITSIFS